MTFETGVEADECLKYNGHAYDNKQITVKVSAKKIAQNFFSIMTQKIVLHKK